MAYVTSEFYIISEFFDDDLGIMAQEIADNSDKDPDTAHKDLMHARYKGEYIEILKKGIKKHLKPHIAKTKAKMAQKGGIWVRDDFENIEAYSIFKDPERKKAIPKNRKSKPNKYEQLILNFSER